LAPGSPGEFYNGITSGTTLDMNNAGKYVFNSSLRNAATGGTQTAASALFSNTTGSLTMLARAGSMAMKKTPSRQFDCDRLWWNSARSRRLHIGYPHSTLITIGSHRIERELGRGAVLARHACSYQFALQICSRVPQ
jgi:hypothetical protein